MATEKGITQDFDLDKTDKLPILVGAMFDAEIADDAIPMAPDEARINRALRMDYSDDADPEPVLTPVPSPQELGALAVASSAALPAAHSDFLRPSPVDLPLLAESMRSVEERISRQQADYDTLSRSFERSRESENAALARVAALERDADLLRAALDTEQGRVKEQEKIAQERHEASEAARSRAEGALLEAERNLSEAKTLKDALASRDATIVQVLHSLGERDAQLTALQQAHVQIHQTVEEHGKVHAKLQSDLNAAQSKSIELAQQLTASGESSSLLGSRAKRAEAEVNLLRAELGAVRATSTTYLEQLRTREFRRGFDENLFRELDARMGAADAGHSSLKSERDRLQSESANSDLKIAEQTAALEKARATTAAQASAIAQHTRDLKLAESANAELQERFAAADAERARLSHQLAERNTSLAEARAAASGDVQRITQRLESAEQRQVEQATQISNLQAEHAAKLGELRNENSAKLVQVQGENLAKITQMQADYTRHSAQLQADHASQLASLQAHHKTGIAELAGQAEEREQEMTVLMAHLHEARKPLEPVENEVKRLTAELASKAKAFDDLSAEVQQLRGSLERTRGALEEREFLIRRLERAESNNANVLGRIQTSMERLGSASLSGEAAAPATAPEWAAELIRVDGERNITHTLSRRTRIGRASGCELQVDSTSVSRHHALVVSGPRETVIEDLNSTNGVIVNGRKISRAFLNDGDVVIVGDVHFRFAAKTANPRPATVLEAPAGG